LSFLKQKGINQKPCPGEISLLIRHGWPPVGLICILEYPGPIAHTQGSEKSYKEGGWTTLHKLACAKLIRLFVCFFGFFFFRDRVSLCSPGCPGTHFVDQAGLELRNPPASASRVLGLKACATTPGLPSSFVPSTIINTSPCHYNVFHIYILHQKACDCSGWHRLFKGQYQVMPIS
jgi:hypothetical protein